MAEWQNEGAACLPDNGDPCTHDVCRNGICVNERICPSGEACCSGYCCEGVCCPDTGQCCSAPQKCCGSGCCADDEVCCNGQCAPCCDETTGDPCTGACCNPPGGPCCGGNIAAGTESCCGTQCCVGPCFSGQCCPDENGVECSDAPNHCCPEFNTCCGSNCCPPGEKCCGSNCCTCCDPTTGGCCSNCCSDGTCCSHACDGCVDNGTLSGGTITTSPDPACLGETITFTAGGTTDSGGTKWINCAETAIPPGGVTYQWTLSLPAGYPAPLPPTSGQGASASVPALAAGSYTASFTAIPSRTDCPPGDLGLGSKSTTAVRPDLVFDGIPEDDEETEGGYLCLNNDDDNTDGTPDKDEAGATVGENDLAPMLLSVPGVSSGKITLESTSTRAKVFETSDRSNQVTLPACWATPSESGCGSLANMPGQVWVEGFIPSGSLRDVTFKLRYDKDSTSCEDLVKVTVMGVTFNSPRDANGNGLIDEVNSEFAYNDQDPGQLDVPVRIQIVPDVAALRTELSGRVKLHVTAIEDSHGSQATVALSWSTPDANPLLGVAVYSGGTWDATATFTGLPMSNAAFGEKTSYVFVFGADGSVFCSRMSKYEVFFPPLARNNPGQLPDDIPMTIDLDQVEVRTSLGRIKN